MVHVHHLDKEEIGSTFHNDSSSMSFPLSKEYSHDNVDDQDEMMGIPHASKSILDQVDDYLHESHYKKGYEESEHNDENYQQKLEENHTNQDEENRSACTTSSTSPSIHTNGKKVDWAPDSMQIDLDHLSNSLFIHDDTMANDNDNDTGNSPDEKRHVDGIPRGSIRSDRSQTDLNHVRPEMIFSPMASPMVMPTNSSSLSANDTPYLSGRTGQGSGTNTPYLNSTTVPGNNLRSNRKNATHNTISQFSPLSSPALTAIDQAQMINFELPESTITSIPKRSSASSIRSKKKYSNNNSLSSSNATVATTTTTTTSSKVIKNSPHLNASTNVSRRQYTAEHFKNNKPSSPATNSNSNDSWDDMIFKLPESSITSTNNPKMFASAPTTGAGAANDEYTPKSSSSGGVLSSPESRMTPATLMNYPKVILPSNTKSAFRYNHNDHSTSPKDLSSNTTATTNVSDPNDSNIKVLRATESPVIKPRQHHQSLPPVWNGLKHNTSSSTPNKANEQLISNGSNTNMNANTSILEQTTSESLEETMKTSNPGSAELRPRHKTSASSSSISLVGGNVSSDEGDQLKKAVHKVAEQGRRNRLNTALNDLNSLLPPELKESITIPSKATTVELACAYIRQLIDSKDDRT